MNPDNFRPYRKAYAFFRDPDYWSSTLDEAKAHAKFHTDPEPHDCDTDEDLDEEDDCNCSDNQCPCEGPKTPW
jgi:hypothetical protein